MSFQRNNCYAVFYPVGRNTIGYFSYWRRVLFHQLFKHRISLVIDKDASWLDLVNKDPELFKVYFEVGENIDMVPGNPRNNGNMGKKEMEFRSFFKSTGGVFIPFADDHRRPGDVHRLGKT